MTDGFALKSWVIDLINKVAKKIVPKYSKDETVVGTWINGKPIYRKVIVLDHNIETSSYNTWIDIYDVSSMNVDYLVNVIISSGEGDDNTIRTSTSLWAVRDNYLKEWAYHDFNSAKIIIMEYTKTTDKATN